MRIYVAGPMATSGEPDANLNAAACAAAELIEAGHAPYVPHASWVLDAVRPTSREHWLRADRAWLEACGAVLRLPGESVGADEEVHLALALGIPVYPSIEALLGEVGERKEMRR